MKKNLPYILFLVLLIAIITLFITGRDKKARQLDERITLRRQDKIPYGTYAAFKNLDYLFPKAKIFASRREPGYWDSLSSMDKQQAYIVVTDRFTADESELKQLISFAENGNDVFISARYISSAADKIFGCSSSAYDLSYISFENIHDEMKINLTKPPFINDSTFRYPGRTFNSYFSFIDSTTTQMLGYNGSNHPMFIKLKIGEGSFYIHLEPLAFSNYFILHKDNFDYYEKALSVIDPGVNKIVWDEYYTAKNKKTNDNKKSWFSVLMNMQNDAGKKSFQAAFWLLIILLLLYVLMEMRRKQTYIPVLRKLKNDSLDFVKTIGRLYFDKGDHRNLSRKMTAYFLEHVRNKYKLATGNLDDEFINNLQHKSGVDEASILSIVTFIKYIEENPSISQRQLTDFHKQLELFYQKV